MKSTSKRIFLISTYPIKNPQHGGQKRTMAIYNAYQAISKSVIHCSVFYRGFYKDYEKYDIPLSRESETMVMQSPFTGDIICGDAIYKDQKVRNKIKAILLKFSPDIIHIEQPYSYLGIRPLLKQLNISPIIIYGSQNIESPMKREILEGINTNESEIKKIEKIIQKIENELSKNSDLLIACTDSDAATYKNMGAKKVVLAPNGIAPLRSNSQSKIYWQERFNKLDVKRLILFIGSAHPPNWTGFLTMLSKGLGFIPNDTRIILAGSISDYFDKTINLNGLDIQDATFWLRAISVGRLSEERLGSLIKLSDLIILPITEGGGSNLKTAEAILANKKIVATSHALRSFEWFKTFPNVWISDDPKVFRQYIIEALNTPFIKRTKDQHLQAHKVEWKYSLEKMITAVQEL